MHPAITQQLQIARDLELQQLMATRAPERSRRDLRRRLSVKLGGRRR